MSVLTDATLSPIVDLAYEAAVDADRWPALLAKLGGLFHSHFADVFARTDDNRRWHGLAHGLSHDDYQDGFLDTWVKRNVWAERRPVRHAGEVVSTRSIIEPEEFKRTEMYNDYLAPRELQEGLRLSLWTGEGWVQDISLLRPWKAGPFSGAEMHVAGALLPHLQRSTAVSRRLREAGSLAKAGLAALDAISHAAMVLDTAGRPLQINRQAETLLAEADALWLCNGGLRAANHAVSEQLQALLAAASGLGGAGRSGGRVHLPCLSGHPPYALIASPLDTENNWAALRAPAILILITASRHAGREGATALVDRFGLTASEVALAVELMAGNSLADIAIKQGRSVHTLRTHCANLMNKTGTHRQAALIRVLLHTAPSPSNENAPRFT